MLKLIYAHTASTPSFPSYVNVSQIVGVDTLKVVVRDHARIVEHENGAHFDAGHTSESLLTKEHALDLANAIIKHYAEEPVNKSHQDHAHVEDDGIGADLRARFFPDDNLPHTHSVYEETDTVGEVSHTRRLILDSIEDPLSQQVARLASFILTNFLDEVTSDEAEGVGAVDVAIRLLGDFAALRRARIRMTAYKEDIGRDRIAAGLRAGQAELDSEMPEGIVEVAHPDGANEPARASAPLGAFDVVTPQPEAPFYIPPADVAAEDDEIPF